ncbi:MAG TPA: F0F1 ATP synthase subunit B [Gemmataceae bacterium]|nr:F0F1 ATP synthase subunit B [Gemmataceae bacterium]
MVRFRPSVILLLSALVLVAAAPTPAPAKDEPAAAKEGQAEQASIFEPRLDLAIWTIVVFVVLLWVLGRFAWKPMLAGLQKREQNMKEAVQDAQAARQEAQRLRDEILGERNKIEDMRRDIIQKAQGDAQRTAEELLAKAKAEMQAERDRARRDLETAKDQALQDIWRQAADLAAMVSTKAIRRSLTPEDHRRFVDEALVDLRQAGNGQKASASV